VTSNDDCKTSIPCTQTGLCTAKEGKCIAASNADCQQAEICKKVGRCHAKDGKCDK
jgi:hypothetical protein